MSSFLTMPRIKNIKFSRCYGQRWYHFYSWTNTIFISEDWTFKQWMTLFSSLFSHHLNWNSSQISNIWFALPLWNTIKWTRIPKIRTPSSCDKTKAIDIKSMIVLFLGSSTLVATSVGILFWPYKFILTIPGLLYKSKKLALVKKNEKKWKNVRK